MERVKSIFRRNTERRRPEHSTAEPNGDVFIEHTTHDQGRPESAEFHRHEIDHQPHQQALQSHPGQFSTLDGTGERLPTTPAPSSGRLEIELQNDTESSQVYAYISK